MMIRPIKKLPVFPPILGSVGWKFFLFLSVFYMLISGQNCFLGLNIQQNYYKTKNKACRMKNIIINPHPAGPGCIRFHRSRPYG